MALNSRYSTLPIGFLGIAGILCTPPRSLLYGLTRCAVKAPISSISRAGSSTSTATSSFKTTNAVGSSLPSSSSCPTTAASSTALCPFTTPSISRGDTWVPLYLIRSCPHGQRAPRSGSSPFSTGTAPHTLFRPVMNRYPRESTWPRSPVLIHSSTKTWRLCSSVWP